MASVTHIDSEAMCSAREKFDTALSAYRSQKDVVKNCVDQLLDHWEGDGQKAFEKDYKLLYRQLEDLQEVLLDLRKGLVDAEEQYITSDAEIAKSIASA